MSDLKLEVEYKQKTIANKFQTQLGRNAARMQIRLRSELGAILEIGRLLLFTVNVLCTVNVPFRIESTSTEER